LFEVKKIGMQFTASAVLGHAVGLAQCCGVDFMLQLLKSLAAFSASVMLAVGTLPLVIQLVPTQKLVPTQPDASKVTCSQCVGSTECGRHPLGHR
jgi:hypothetical protein